MVACIDCQRPQVLAAARAKQTRRRDRQNLNEVFGQLLSMTSIGASRTTTSTWKKPQTRKSSSLSKRNSQSVVTSTSRTPRRYPVRNFRIRDKTPSYSTSPCRRRRRRTCTACVSVRVNISASRPRHRNRFRPCRPRKLLNTSSTIALR